jgi:CheY-like chemotaxis protein
MKEIGLADHCDFVHNGQEAVIKFAELTESGQDVTHILTDVMMPRFNGLQTVQTIQEYVRDRNEKSNIRVVVLPTIVFITAHKTMHFERHAASIGVPTVLQKPLTLEQLKSIFN